MMGKRSNVIDIEIARAIKEAGLKPTAEVMEEVLDRIDKRPDKVHKKNNMPFSKDYHLVKKVLGCERASALFSRLDYRFNIMPDGFYKFMAPCKNRYYRKGDSLAEEMELHRDTILVASKKIVTAYKSKALYEEAISRLGKIGAFKGMPYLSYLDNNTHQTFYLRNKQVAGLMLKGQDSFRRKMLKRIKFFPYLTVFRLLKLKNPERRIQEIPECHVQEFPERAFRKFRNADVPEPAVYKASAPPTKNTYKEYSLSISLSEESSPSEVITQNPIRERKIKIVDLEGQPKLSNASEMVEIWKKHTGSMQGLSPKTVVLEECLEDQFNGSLEKWESYCKMIAKSKLLMGEKGKFKAYLGWAIKPENIEDVLSGDKYDQDRSNSSETIPDAKQIAEDEEKEILSLDIPETIRELRLRLLKRVGGIIYRGHFKNCLIDQIGDHSVNFKHPFDGISFSHNTSRYKDHILVAVGDLFQNITIKGEELLGCKKTEKGVEEVEKVMSEWRSDVKPTKVEEPMEHHIKINKKWEESIRAEMSKKIEAMRKNEHSIT